MKIVKVKLQDRSYDIVIGREALQRIPKLLENSVPRRDAFIITNSRLKKIYGKSIESVLCGAGYTSKFALVPFTEEAKSSKVVIEVLNKIASYDRKKKIFIVALGGGVIGDLAGFVASIYRRGVPYIQIPTTLLSQVDSAIGGKVAIDLPMGKNLAGAFYQPRLVVSDISLLRTLPKKELRNGLAEIVKYGLIKDLSFFQYLEANHRKVMQRETKALLHVIKRCSEIKADTVARDERDNRDIRIALNCGHTIAHAIEAAGSYRDYTHGEAVAIGLLAETELSCALGIASSKTLNRLESLLKAIGLPSRMEGIDVSAMMKAQEHDKKIITGVNRFVLPARIGNVKIVENIPTGLIRDVIIKRGGGEK
jgi:3-dehydroquinate synthase